MTAHHVWFKLKECHKFVSIAYNVLTPVNWTQITKHYRYSYDNCPVFISVIFEVKIIIFIYLIFLVGGLKFGKRIKKNYVCFIKSKCRDMCMHFTYYLVENNLKKKRKQIAEKKSSCNIKCWCCLWRIYIYRFVQKFELS